MLEKTPRYGGIESGHLMVGPISTTTPFASQSVDYRVTQIVDETKGVHGMIPKKIFVDRKEEYWFNGR